MEQLQEWIKYGYETKWIVILALIIFPPFGIYLLWKCAFFNSKNKWIGTALASFWFLIYLASQDPGQGNYEKSYGSCSATFEQNGCTYFRDDNCNVIAKSCD